MRIVFVGTAELACASLELLVKSTDWRVVGVVTQPDRPQGRHLQVQPPPVKDLALRLQLPILQPERIRHETALQAIGNWKPDLIAVAAYGQILPQALLDMPRLGCLNVHASLLPKYRGAAPIQWAILNDEVETGVTIMKLNAGLDTGEILAHQRTPIATDDNAQTLHDRLAILGAQLLVETIPAYVDGTLQPRPQPGEGATYASKITKQMGCLDWSKPARALWNCVRAFTPWPGAYTLQPAHPAPHILKIWEAEVIDRSGGQPGEVLQADAGGLAVACGQQALRIVKVQRENKRRMGIAEFLAGNPIAVGLKLG